ncbi:ABC transporter permease subunit [Saccharopolyspora sp. K220]|uniref:ABC transporter permease n=1 Tax=Saccharopolyspora soli TaxID=2926618 RepID=UPI001F59B8F9|nr:ABC transporter permease subunit [Saccharopolyspora soli]MCI2416031.1 ABC transporter permease subunit [Saccharopolyspora soli]
MAVLFVGPLVLLIFGLIAVPFVDSIVLSFTARHGADTVFVGLANFFALPSDPTFRAGAQNSYVFTAYSVLFKIVIGLIVALLLHNLRRGRALLAGIVLLPWVIPTVVTAFTWRAMLDPLFGGVNSLLTWLGIGPVLEWLHLVDQWPATWLADPDLAMPAVIAVNVWKGIPFFAVNFLAGLKAIDAHLYEAAAVDGADAWQRFLHITLPGLRYVIVVTTLLSSIWTFNNFDLIWLLTQGGPGQATTPYVLVAYTKAIQQLQYGAGAAVALVMVPIVGVLVFILARYLRNQGPGVKEGAISRFVVRYRRPLTWIGLVALVVSLVVLRPSIAWKAAVGLAIIVGLGVLFGRFAGGTNFTGGPPRQVSRRIPAWLAMAVVLLFVVGPLYWIVVTAFKTDTQITSRANDLFPVPWSLEQFTTLFDEQPFGTWFLNTILVSGVATALTMVFAALAGYALARLRFRGAQTLTGAVLITYVMPGALLFIPLYQLLSDLQLIDTRWALILTYPTFTLPFATWLLLGYFRSIPVELEEAAMIDGATRFQAFLRIVMPLAKPAMLAVALFTLTNAWNEFLLAFVFITSDDLKTLPVGLQSMIFGDVVPYGVLAAASLLISIPVVLMYSFGQRFLTEGLTAGAMKG